MSQHVSPFAALTGAERQIKWLEYQSIKLPYIQSDIQTETEADTAPQPPPVPAPVRTAPQPPPAPAPVRTAPQPPPEVPRGPVRQDFQRTRHSQYDAVIARMKQAELQTGRYHPMS